MTEPYNAANSKHVKRRADRVKLRQDQLNDEFKELLKLQPFRRFIWQLIHERCQLMQSPFNPNGSTQTLNIGRQDVGRELWAQIETAEPMAIPQMMLEYSEWQPKE